MKNRMTYGIALSLLSAPLLLVADGYTEPTAQLIANNTIESPYSPPISETPDDRVNFPSNFQVAGGWDLFIEGDYLYWSAREDGLYFAHTGKGTGTTAVPPSDNSINFKGRLKKIDPEFESGFRIGAGINFPKSGFELKLQWTQFFSKASDSASSSTGTLFPLWAHPDTNATSYATFAKGKWNLKLNLLDLECGRSSWFGGKFSLRPFFGIRWLWIDQALKNTYNYATTPIIIGKLHSESDFSGGGVRAGANVRYAFCHGLSLWGVASGSLLYGEFDNNFSLKEDQFTIGKTRDTHRSGISTLQLSLGMGWDRHLFKDRCHIELHVGWEQNGFFGVNQMNHYMQQLGKGKYFSEKGNMNLQGLVAGGRFDF